jgi:putative transposase
MQRKQLSRRLTVNANAVTTELGMYDLIAYVIMPNYVHILIQPKTVLPKITKWIEGVSARQANSILGRTGMSFWQESFDRWVRSAAELEKIVHYIETNPVRANLVVEPKFWRYSSAAIATHRLKPVPPI